MKELECIASSESVFSRGNILRLYALYMKFKDEGIFQFYYVTSAMLHQYSAFMLFAYFSTGYFVISQSAQ